jgi:hypothetical protein
LRRSVLGNASKANGFGPWQMKCSKAAKKTSDPDGSIPSVKHPVQKRTEVRIEQYLVITDCWVHSSAKMKQIQP